MKSTTHVLAPGIEVEIQESSDPAAYKNGGVFLKIEDVIYNYSYSDKVRKNWRSWAMRHLRHRRKWFEQDMLAAQRNAKRFEQLVKLLQQLVP